MQKGFALIKVTINLGECLKKNPPYKNEPSYQLIRDDFKCFSN